MKEKMGNSRGDLHAKSKGNRRDNWYNPMNFGVRCEREPEEGDWT